MPAPHPPPPLALPVPRGLPRRRGLPAALADLLALVVPVACAGCGREDVPWCAACAALLAGPPVRCERGAPRLDLVDRVLLPAWALATYAGPVRAAVGAWKDGGRADLDRVLRAALTPAARWVALESGLGAGPEATAEMGPEGRREPRPRPAPPVLVVPVPSTAAARRRRGRAPVDALAQGVASGLRAAGRPALVARVLARRGGADLAGLGAQARVAALDGRVRVRRRHDLRGRTVVLVDDVLTTGATVAACVHALRGAGADVVACCVLAATPSPAHGRAPAPAA